jgi:predicted lipoprotein with Yx(FWY)xxD motif
MAMTNQLQAAASRPSGQHGWIRLRLPVLAASLASIAVLTGACGASQSSPMTSAPPSTGPGASTTPFTLAAAQLPTVGSVLTGPNRMTLYFFATDTSGASKCTGQCAVVWPPLVAPAGSAPVLSAGTTGTLSLVARPDGTHQVSYRGHLLYYFQGDTAPGQDNGQGVDGTWFVVSTSGATPAGNLTTTTSPAGGGGGVGF